MISKQITDVLDLLRKQNVSKTKIALVQKAINFANKYHADQKRQSGEPFISHPLSVAKILVEWGVDIPTICAGILHDVVEDTTASIELLKKEFGEEITTLVEAVTKVSSYSSKNRADNRYDLTDKNTNNYILQVFLGMSKDLRVMIIKLADRLHNVSTLRFLKVEKQKRIALETQEIYANIAGRLGMFSVKTQLNDMCMKILEPLEYKRVKAYIDVQVKKYNDVFIAAKNRLKTCLDNNYLSYHLEYRVKSVYSTSEKMKTTDSILDLFALRIIVEKPLDCYLCLGIVHSNFYNLSKSFKDFISTPKDNLYQSLHTGIVYNGLNIEVQIRTKEMDLNANFGVAAHWRYKEKNNNDFYLENMMSSILEGVDPKQDSLSIIKNISKQRFINVLDKTTMIFKVIPENLSVLDYIFTIDKNKFSYWKDIFINNAPVNMYQIIQAGDIIEIVYSTTKTIKQSWEHFTKDPIIKKYIKDEVQSIFSNLETSSEQFVASMTKACGSYCNKKYILDFIQKHFNFYSIKDFIDAMKFVNITTSDLTKLFKNHWKDKRKMLLRIRSLSWKWLIAKSLFETTTNIYFSEIVITKCCSKIPPMNVVGVLNGDSLHVHRFDCPRINNKNKMVVLKWDAEKVKKSDRTFQAKLFFEGPFSPDYSPAIIATITKYKAVISNFGTKKNKDTNMFSLDLIIYVKNYSNLEKIVAELQNKALIYSWKLI